MASFYYIFPSRTLTSPKLSDYLHGWSFVPCVRPTIPEEHPRRGLTIDVSAKHIGNAKFLRSPEYLLNHTPNNQNTKYTDEIKYENRKRKQRMSYSESAYERYNKVRALAARAAGKFPNSNNLRLQKRS
ncbi:hypothetical protein YC2023_059824 [Brassica napus]